MSAIFGARRFTEEEQEELITRCAEMSDLPRKAIARKLGVSLSTVGRYLAIGRERGIVPPPRRIKDPQVVAALLADLAKPGWSPTELAHKYGYTKAGVYYQAVKHGYHEYRTR